MNRSHIIRRIAATVVAGAFAVVLSAPAQADPPALSPRGGSELAYFEETSSVRPDDRAVRGPGSLATRVSGLASTATRPDDRAGVRGPTAFETVAARAEPTSFDWGDALLGGLGGMVTALLLTGLLFLVVSRRSRVARIA